MEMNENLVRSIEVQNVLLNFASLLKQKTATRSGKIAPMNLSCNCNYVVDHEFAVVDSADWPIAAAMVLLGLICG